MSLLIVDSDKLYMTSKNSSEATVLNGFTIAKTCLSTRFCEHHDHKCYSCCTATVCQNSRNEEHRCGCYVKDNPTKQTGLAKKIVVVTYLALFLLMGSLCMSTHNCHASILGPDKDVVRGWLYNKKVVVGKGLFGIDRTEVINVYNVKTIEIISYLEERKWAPYSDNIGSVRVNFTYVSGGVEREYEAMFTYIWESGLTGKIRHLKDVSIKNK